MLLFSNQTSGLLNQRYLKKEYIWTFSHTDRHINNKEPNRKSFHARYNNSLGTQKMTKARNGKNQIFQNFCDWLLISFNF